MTGVVVATRDMPVVLVFSAAHKLTCEWNVKLMLFGSVKPHNAQIQSARMLLSLVEHPRRQLPFL